MSTVFSEAADVALVVLSANTTASIELRSQLDQAMVAGARSIVVDASTVDAIPSASISAMLLALQACRRRGGHLLVRNPSRRAMNQLDRTGLRQVFQVELQTTRNPTASHPI